MSMRMTGATRNYLRVMPRSDWQRGAEDLFGELRQPGGGIRVVDRGERLEQLGLAARLHQPRWPDEGTTGGADVQCTQRRERARHGRLEHDRPDQGEERQDPCLA